ncbi:MAG TPA: protein kinase [Nannocystaceae bacterium]|nr:protein kinase [Nannocystaceae bacterium]
MQPTPTDSSCLSEPTLVAYVEGWLSEADARAAAVHLDACSECLRVVALLGVADAEPNASTRYTVHEEIARGGMGRILAAWDERLQRPVALKTVRSADALSRGRFEREMLVTARLQHPSIVPIYDGGTLPDGAPYYAMRRVEGRELEACIRESVTLAQRLALLRPFIALVDAIAYAHARGFVHRDLKPRNVLVGRFGETVVLDWGLARSVDATELDEHGEGDSVQDGLTNTGAVMGTPGYIAPEIVQGLRATAASDVYSLGVILAQILTGDPRTHAEGSLRAAGAPADLVAITKRATQPRPGDRYADAHALAEDLRRFEAGRLVDARAYGLLDRIVRFVRLHRAAAGVAVLAGFALLAMGGWSYRNVAAARDRAEAEREAAEGLIDFALEDLSTQLRGLGRTDVLRSVVQQVDGYYEERAPATDERSALRVGRALTLHGAIAASTGDDATAVAKLEQARDVFAAHEHSERAAHMRCDAIDSLAIALRNLGRLDEAESAARECVALAERWIARDPDAPAWTLTLAAVESTQVLLQLARGDSDSARTTMPRVLARIDAGTWEGDELARAVNLRRIVGSRMGVLAMNDRRLDDAATHFRRALRDAEELRRLRPGNSGAVAAVAGARLELAAALEALGRSDDAEEQLRTAIGTYRLLLELEPANLPWVRNLSRARRTLADGEFRRGRVDDAIATTRENIAAVDRAVELRVPEAWDLRMSRGFLRVELGDFLQRSGQPDTAAHELERGLAEMEELVAEHTDAESLHRYGFALLLHADFAMARDDLDRAQRSLMRARELAERGDTSPGGRIRLAEPTARLAVVAWKSGDHEAARTRLRQALSLLAEAQQGGASASALAELRALLDEPARALGEPLPP